MSIRAPIPFTITIQGVGYDVGKESVLNGLFNKRAVIEGLEATLRKLVLGKYEVDITVGFHQHKFRDDWVNEYVKMNRKKDNE